MNINTHSGFNQGVGIQHGAGNMARRDKGGWLIAHSPNSVDRILGENPKRTKSGRVTGFIYNSDHFDLIVNWDQIKLACQSKFVTEREAMGRWLHFANHPKIDFRYLSRRRTEFYGIIKNEFFVLRINVGLSLSPRFITLWGKNLLQRSLYKT